MLGLFLCILNLITTRWWKERYFSILYLTKEKLSAEDLNTQEGQEMIK